jgi:hypothetical protein
VQSTRNQQILNRDVLPRFLLAEHQRHQAIIPA